MGCEFVDVWILKPGSPEAEYGPVAVYLWAPAIIIKFGLCKSGECLVAVSSQQLWKNSSES